MKQWQLYLKSKYQDQYSSNLYNDGAQAVLSVASVAPTYGQDAELVDGRVILRDFWDYQMGKRPEILIFGEDVGKIGGVNQTCEDCKRNTEKSG